MLKWGILWPGHWEEGQGENPTSVRAHRAGWQCSEGILFPPGYPLSSCELFSLLQVKDRKVETLPSSKNLDI